jgi:hypothetical protein
VLLLDNIKNFPRSFFSTTNPILTTLGCRHNSYPKLLDGHGLILISVFVAGGGGGKIHCETDLRFCFKAALLITRYASIKTYYFSDARPYYQVQ